MSLVLIVDDAGPLAEQYAYDLQRLAGHQTITAGDGRAALDLVTREPVDCVLLDLEMPGMDGFEVLRELGRRGSRVPVIVYTATGDYDRCAQAIRLGAVSFIDKAEPMERVVQEIAQALERRRLSAGDAVGPEDVPPEIRDDAAAERVRGGTPALTFHELKAEAERQIIVAALERNGWQITRTAESLGLADHSSLLKIMRRHDISRE